MHLGCGKMLLSLILLSTGRQTPADIKSQALALPLWTSHVGIILSSRLTDLCFSNLFSHSFVCPFMHVSIRLLIRSSTQQIFIACQLCAGDTEVRRRGMDLLPWEWWSSTTSTGCCRGSEKVLGPGAEVRKGVPQVVMPSTSSSRQRDGKALSTTTTSYPRNQATGVFHLLAASFRYPVTTTTTASLSKPCPAQLPNSLRIQCPV